MSRLVDIVEQLDRLEPDATIYAAEPWNRESVALAAHEPVSGGLPPAAAALGLTYFLEVSDSRQFVKGWKSSQTASPSVEQVCDRLIQYATFDA